MESREDCNEKPMTTSESQRCDSVFPSKFALRSHTLRDHNQHQNLECQNCGNKFKRDIRLKHHLRQHMERGEVNWNCAGEGLREPHSSIAAESAKLLDIASPPTQIKTQSEKRQPKNQTTQVRRSKQKTCELSTYVCRKCSETFSSLDDLNGHLKTYWTDDILQINKCSKCKSYFRSAFDLRLHVLEIHHSIKEFQCSKCFVEYEKDEKSQLEQHLRLHLANKSELRCPQCETLFTRLQVCTSSWLPPCQFLINSFFYSLSVLLRSST